MLEDYDSKQGSAFEESQKSAENWEGKLNKLSNTFTDFTQNFVDTDFVKGFLDVLNGGVTTLDKITESFGGAASAIAILSVVIGGLKLKHYVKDVGGITTAMANAKTGITTLTTALNISKTALLGWGTVITGTVLALSYLSKETERVAERATNALNEYSSAKDKLSSNDSTIKDISEDYEKLAKGVDEFGNNISLNTAEYTRYNEIVNQIADMFPQMVQGYTSEGNAIIKTKGNVEELTKAYLEQVEAAKASLRVGGSDVFSNFKNQLNNPNGLFGGGTNKVDEQVFLRQIIDGTLSKSTKSNMTGASDYASILKNAGIDIGIFDNSKDILEKLDMAENKQLIADYYKSLSSTIESEAEKVKPVISAWLSTDNGYNGLSETQKGYVNSIVADLNGEFLNQFNSDTEAYANIVESFVEPLKNSDFSKGFDLVFNAKTEMNDGSISVGEYQNRVKAFMDTISGLPEDTQKYYGIILDFDTGSSSIDTMIENIKGKLINSDDDKTTTLSLDDMKVAYELENTGEMSFEELKVKIQEAKVLAKQIADEEAITYGFNLTEDQSKEIDSFQSSLSSIKKALEDVNNIDSGTLMDLIQSNPDADWDSYLSGTRSLKEILEELSNDTLQDLISRYPDLENVMSDLFNDTFNEAASSVDDLCGALDTLSDKFKSLESAYKETQEDGFKFLSPEAMSGLKKDFGGLPGWDEFYKSVTEGNPSIEETRKLLSDLANTAVDNSDVMRNLTQANKDYAIASLEADGITNAKEVVNTRLNDLLSQQEQALNDLSSANMSTAVSGESLLDMTGAEVGALFEQMNQAGFTSQALYNLAEYKGYVTDTVIRTDGDNSNLNDLTNAAGISTTAVDGIGTAINGVNGNPLVTNGSIKNLQSFHDAIRQTINSLSTAGSTFAAFNQITGTALPTTVPQLQKITLTGGNTSNSSNATWKPSGDNTTYSPKNKDTTSSKKKKDSSTKKETSEVFDWIENKLKNLANKTKKIADSIKDNMSSALKSSKLQSQIKSITSEITANEQAYDKYMKKADSVGLSSKYKKLVNEGSLDISTIKDESLINKIKSYEEWKNKADDCKSSISELKDTQAELFEQWANIPIEEAEKKIDKLTKKLDIIQGKSSIASMGGSAIARLNESANKSVNEARSKQIVASTLKASANMEAKMAKVSLTGVKLSSEQKKQLNSGQEISTKGLSKADAKKVKAYNKKITASNSANTAYANAKENYNTQKTLADQIRTYGGSSYTVQNKLVDDEVSNMKSQNKANKTAYEKATKNANSALKEQTTAQKKVASAQNKLLNSKNLTDAQKKAIKSGKEVSLKGLSGSDLKNAKAYNEAVKKLKTTTDNYNTTLDAQAEAAQNAAQSEIELAQAEVEAEKTKFDNIQAYYSNKGNYLSSTTQAKSDAIALKEARGESLTSSDYNAQISAMSAERANMVEQQNKLQSQLNASVKSGKIKEGTEEWWAMKTEIAEVASGITAIDIEVEGLYDTLRENVDYRRFSDALDKAEQLRKSISSFSSLIDDDMLFDTDGNLTDFGLAKLGSEYASMEQYQNDIKTLLAEAAQLEKDKKDSSKHLSQSEYEEKMKQNQENLQNALQSIKSSRDTILSITKQMAQKELDVLNKVIDARTTLMKKKKEYYDYDKTLSNKNKELQLLIQKRNALEGVADAESLAEKARLDAEIANAQDDIKDTIQDHIYNIQIEGLDDLKTELQEDYENYINALSQNLDEIEKIMNGVGSTVSGAATTINETIKKILSQYGISPSDIGLPGFASGGLVDAVKKNGDSGIASLKVGEYVLDTDMTKLATTTLPLLNRLATNSVLADLVNLNLSRGVTSGQTSVNISYDNMINIEGNANQDTVKEIEKMIPKISKAVQADIVRDRRKKG